MAKVFTGEKLTQVRRLVLLAATLTACVAAADHSDRPWLTESSSAA